MSEPATLTPEEFMRTAGDLVSFAKRRQKNATLAAVETVIRRTRMNEDTKRYLLNQIDALRVEEHALGEKADEVTK